MFNVYIITNAVNGKQYVGLTTKKIKSRLTRHIYDAHRRDRNRGSKLLVQAIRKYGKENFSIALVSDRFTSIDELKKGETEAIKLFNTLAPNGYNLKLEEESNYIYSEELSRRVSRQSQGRKNARSFSKFLGVFQNDATSVKAYIRFLGKSFYLGIFSSEKEAAIAYDLKAIELYGNNAKLNFNENRESYLTNPSHFSCVKRVKRIRKTRMAASLFHGVRKIRKTKWRTIYSFRTFNSEEDAAVAYDIETVALKNDKKLNFPENLIKYLNKEILPNYFSGRKRSKYKGVSFNQGKWTARIFYKGKMLSLRTFSCELDAAIAYDVKSFSLYGCQQRLNFPENIEKYRNKEIIPNFYKDSRKLSKYKGVTLYKNRYYARIVFNKRTKNLGGFSTEEEAARAYNQAAIAFFGDEAKLNHFN